jgi:hypothetical protein
VYVHAIVLLRIQGDSDSDDDELHYYSYSSTYAAHNGAAAAAAVANRRVLMSVLQLANTLSNGEYTIQTYHL